MASDTYHEPYDRIPAPTRDRHRAITSLIEELEAIDWYQQRADVCDDEELRAVLLHNKDEEIEHAMMVLEWIRRNNPDFDEHMRTYLGTEGPITEVEERQERDRSGAPAGSGLSGLGAAPRTAILSARGPVFGSLGIGSLRGV